MAFEEKGLDYSYQAGADLTNQQFRAMAMNANGQAVVAGAAAQSIGVLQNNPPNGGAATVRQNGATKMVVGGVAIAINARIGVDAAGAARAAAAGDAVIGRARTAGAAAALITVQLGSDNPVA